MEIDLASASTEALQDLSRRRSQVCIVGGGIAGLVLADRLAADGIDVILLEAGGRRSPPAAPGGTAAGVELTGQSHEGSREDRPRALGGSSLVWGGQLLPMRPGAGWPVATRDLERFYGEIQKLMGVDELPYGAESFLEARGEPPVAAPEPLPGTTARMSKFAPFAARNLGLSLGERLRGGTRARVVLHARVLGVRPDAGGRVRSVRVRGPSGGELEVEAAYVVLAAGTVETCRLLLASPRSEEAGAGTGIGNRYGQVGRGFHDHLTVEVARFEGRARTSAVALFRPWIVGGVRGTLHGYKLEATDALRAELGLNDALAHVTFEEPASSGVAAVREMLLARQGGERLPGVNWRGLPRALGDTWQLRRDARVNGRRYMSPEVCVGLRINVAQAVPGRSWVGLSEHKDELGQPLARVHWEHAPADRRTVRLFADHLRQHFGAPGFDGLQWHPDGLPLGKGSRAETAGELERPLPGVEDARHAMGGACMGTDPRTSVVDANLRVHGVDNLYVASAAVFPDGRPQLPTLTLMALTLRLADHLLAEPLRGELARAR